MTSSTPSKDDVIALITKGFSNDPRPLSHDECLRIRSELALFSDDDVLLILPQIMEDLVNSHLGNPGDAANAIDVVRYLDVLQAGSDPAFIEEYFGQTAFEKSIKDQQYLRKKKIAQFHSYSSDKVLAILRWLELVASWPELDLYAEEISNITAYWRRRNEL